MREGKDVLTSCYHHFKRQAMLPSSLMIFSEFIRMHPDRLSIQFYDYLKYDNMVRRWHEHLKGWSNRDIHIFEYEELLNDFDGQIDLLENILELKAETRNQPTLKDLCVNPRKGIMGDWKNHFNKSDLEFYSKEIKKSLHGLQQDIL
jgi:hypothetical protein